MLTDATGLFLGQITSMTRGRYKRRLRTAKQSAVVKKEASESCVSSLS